MRASAAACALAAACSAPRLSTAAPVTYTVRSDGSGQFASVQAAVLAASAAHAADDVTFDLRGRFWERVHVYGNLTGALTFVGSGVAPLDALIIYNVSGAAVGTFNSWTVIVDAQDVTFAHLAIANSAAGYNRHVAGQSVALHLNGGSAAAPQRVRVVNSSLLGAQDTLYTGSAHALSYFANSYINGSCDALFGDSSSVFDGCALEHSDTLTAHRGDALVPGTTTHWADGPGTVSAYLLRRCNITLGPWEASAGLVLGRPWGPLAQVVLTDCWLGRGIDAVGWGDWSHNCTAGHSSWCNETVYAEYRSSGPGANPAARAWWSHQLSDAQAANWNVTAVLRGWDPEAELAAGAPRRAAIDAARRGDGRRDAV